MTGAAGTVGNYVVGLCEAKGYGVVASDMNARGLRRPTRGRIVPGDLNDPAVRAQALRGVDYVVHTAGLLDATADAAGLGRVNTDLVVALYEDGADAGVKRFVHMSTCMLYAPRQGIALNEDAAIAPRGPHGLSKQGAEAFLRGRGRDGPAWTILRAAPVYGRRGRHFAASLLAVGPLLRLGMPWIPRFEGGPMHTFVHAEDVARALLFLLADERSAYGMYNVADEDAMSLGERIGHTFDAYGLRTIGSGRTLGFLAPLAKAAARTPGSLRAFDASVLTLWKAVVARYGLKPALRPRLDREAVTLLDDDLVIDCSRLRDLGFELRHPSFATGWAGVLRWYQAEGWVPRY